MKFQVDGYRNLIVRDGSDTEILISTSGFMSNDNKSKAAEYLRGIARQLAELEPFSDEMAALLDEAAAKVSAAKLDEKFLQEVSF